MKSLAVGRRVPVVVAGLVCGGLGWWAGHVATTAQTPSGVSSSRVVLAQAQPASVGRSLPYGVTVSQQAKPVARNALQGVVVSATPGRLGTGEVAYVVAGVPVRVVTGSAPFYRNLTAGVTGNDVRQLEQALVKMRLLKTADTTYDARTEDAVKRWQALLKVPTTGTVPLGEVVAVPSLPATITLGSSISPGAVLSGGEESVLAPSGARAFALELSQDQARQVPTDAVVQVKFNQRTWPARIASSTLDDQSQLTRLVLKAPGGGAVCGSQCGELPADPTVQLVGQVFVVPVVKGLAVPAASLQSSADGTTFVLDPAGQRITVGVKGAGSGLVVVTGLSVGQQVRVGDATGGSPTAPPIQRLSPTGS